MAARHSTATPQAATTQVLVRVRAGLRPSNLTNSTAIGAFATVAESNALVLGSACAGHPDPLLGPKSSLCEEKIPAWEAAAGRGPAPQL